MTPAEIEAAAPEQTREAFDWLAENASELVQEFRDDEPAEWVVYRVNGGRSDREWTRLGSGESPLAAIVRAMEG